jgi:site-specific recombinase XerD
MPAAETIHEAMESFLASLNTEHTRQTYTTPLQHFAAYLAGQGIHVERDTVSALTVDHAIDFVPWLRNDYFSDPDQPAKATLQLYLTAIYRFYRSLLKRGITFAAADIARLEETYRDARNIRGEPRPKDPKLAAVQAIICAARAIPPASGDKPADQNRELSRLRDIAIVETLRSTGCRVGELTNLRRGDLDWLTHSALVKGKGTKYRKVYLDDRAWMALKVYLQGRQDGENEDARALARLPVFCGHGNRSGRKPSPLTTRHVARIIQALAEQADIAEVGVTPHYFRHVFATRALERTENLALVQDMLGHASPATTRIYARTDEEQRREGYARVWDQESTVHEDAAAEGSSSAFQAVASIAGVVRAEQEAREKGVGEEGAASAVRTGALAASIATSMASAFAELLPATGCSLGDLVSLRLDDVDFRARTLRFALPGGSRRARLADRAWDALAHYLHVRFGAGTGSATGAEERRAVHASDLLFRDADGTQLTPERAFDLLKAAAARAGVGEAELWALI